MHMCKKYEVCTVKPIYGQEGCPPTTKHNGQFMIAYISSLTFMPNAPKKNRIHKNTF